MSNKENLMKEHFKKEYAVVEYDKQTPEQRKSFLGRISVLNAVKINRNIIIDNWGHILSSEPLDKKSNSYKTYKEVLNFYREYKKIGDMLDVRVSNLLKTSDEGKDLVDQYAWYNAEILKLLFGLDSVKQELALDVIRAISSETFNAQSDTEYEDNMIAFANYSLSLKNRKNITKNDFKKFKSLKP